MGEFSINSLSGDNSYPNVSLKKETTCSSLNSVFSSKRHCNDNSNSAIKNPFGYETNIKMRDLVLHKTHFLDVAQQYLGIMEVTPEEYSKLSQQQKTRTQAFIIGDKGSITDAWCAHTISFLSKKAGIDVGPYKKSVKSYIDWARSKHTWRAIKTNKMNVSNMTAERKSRAQEIKTQIKNMKEGDFIVWKSDYSVKTDKGVKDVSSSHIGIIESIDVNNGEVTVIEGNANYSKTSPNIERFIVENKADSINGNQEFGEFKEVNRADGLIRKTYTVSELAKFGYSGYIDNSKIIK